MLPEIVIMKIEEKQPSMENMCVKSGAIRFLSPTSAFVESDFIIKYFCATFFSLYIASIILVEGKKGEISN